jgi:hypothetical protein
MTKLAIPLTLLAAASLSGCYMYERDRPADTFPRASIAAQPIAYHAGTGTISRIATSPSYVTAAAGGSAGNTVRAGYPLNRLTIRMDNGAVQYVDTDSNDFKSGMRVELLSDRTIRPL